MILRAPAVILGLIPQCSGQAPRLGYRHQVALVSAWEFSCSVKGLVLCPSRGSCRNLRRYRLFWIARGLLCPPSFMTSPWTLETPQRVVGLSSQTLHTQGAWAKLDAQLSQSDGPSQGVEQVSIQDLVGVQDSVKVKDPVRVQGRVSAGLSQGAGSSQGTGLHWGVGQSRGARPSFFLLWPACDPSWALSVGYSIFRFHFSFPCAGESE